MKARKIVPGNLFFAAGMVAMLGASIQPAQAAESEQALVEQAQALAGQFQGSLKAELVSAMSTGGPINAIDVCKLKVPEIEQQLSTDHWTLARTALKVRNPANAPSDWERSQMNAMNTALAAGKAPADISVAEIRDVDGISTFFYMQPIMTGQLCLGCHGSELSADVQKALAKNYPQDQARGFSEGDLRGAFTFRKVLVE